MAKVRIQKIETFETSIEKDAARVAINPSSTDADLNAFAKAVFDDARQTAAYIIEGTRTTPSKDGD